MRKKLTQYYAGHALEEQMPSSWVAMQQEGALPLDVPLLPPGGKLSRCHELDPGGRRTAPRTWRACYYSCHYGDTLCDESDISLCFARVAMARVAHERLGTAIRMPYLRLPHAAGESPARTVTFAHWRPLIPRITLAPWPSVISARDAVAASLKSERIGARQAKIKRKSREGIDPWHLLA